MRNLIVAMTLVLTVQSASAVVECEKVGRYWRPKNALAVEIAQALRVKTCTGGNFLKVVKGIGESTNFTVAPKRLNTEELIAKLKKSK